MGKMKDNKIKCHQCKNVVACLLGVWRSWHHPSSHSTPQPVCRLVLHALVLLSCLCGFSSELHSAVLGANIHYVPTPYNKPRN